MKLAVVFPGIGYHADKPLLYYGKKLAVQRGYEVREVPYGNFPDGVKGSPEKMKQAFLIALQQAEELLEHVKFAEYEEILFISKSVGTAVASAYGKKHGLSTRNLYFTPVEQSFSLMEQPGVVFSGTEDPWVTAETVQNGCRKKDFPLILIEGGNHSLETGKTNRDLKILKKVIRISGRYVDGKGVSEDLIGSSNEN